MDYNNFTLEDALNIISCEDNNIEEVSYEDVLNDIHDSMLELENSNNVLDLLTSMENNGITMEGLVDKIKEGVQWLWEKAKEMLKKVWDFITKIFRKKRQTEDKNIIEKVKRTDMAKVKDELTSNVTPINDDNQPTKTKIIRIKKFKDFNAFIQDVTKNQKHIDDMKESAKGIEKYAELIKMGTKMMAGFVPDETFKKMEADFEENKKDLGVHFEDFFDGEEEYDLGNEVDFNKVEKEYILPILKEYDMMPKYLEQLEKSIDAINRVFGSLKITDKDYDVMKKGEKVIFMAVKGVKFSVHLYNLTVQKYNYLMKIIKDFNTITVN